MTKQHAQGRRPRPAARRGWGPFAIGFGGVVMLGLVALSLWGRGRPAGANPADTQQVALGQKLYVSSCAACHGANLEGQPNWQAELPTGGRLAPPHDRSGHTWHHPDALLFDITKRGGQASSPAGYRNNMPGFAATLSDTEIWAVLAYIKSTWPADIRAAQERASQTAQ